MFERQDSFKIRQSICEGLCTRCHKPDDIKFVMSILILKRNRHIGVYELLLKKSSTAADKRSVLFFRFNSSVDLHVAIFYFYTNFNLMAHNKTAINCIEI
jgi:hypothetical protein